MRPLFLSTLLLVLLLLPVRGSSAENVKKSAEPFKAGNLIMEHILDAREWYILSWQGEEISIPLPVILYSKHSGWHCFLSSAFHHGQQSFQNLHLEPFGKSTRIAETLPDKSIYHPIDLSITRNVASLWVGASLMLFLFLGVARQYRRREGLAPRGLQNAMELLILFIRNEVVIPAMGRERAARYLPWLLTLFFFILLNNLLGLIPFFPGGANLTGNISVTVGLALITFLVTNLSGTRHYWEEIFWPPSAPLMLKFPAPILPLVELLSVITKPVVLSIRLFANITAGHIIILSFFTLIFTLGEAGAAYGLAASPLTLIFTLFLNFLEMLVAFIQAYIFTLFSALYVGMATETPAKHHSHNH